MSIDSNAAQAAAWRGCLARRDGFGAAPNRVLHDIKDIGAGSSGLPVQRWPEADFSAASTPFHMSNRRAKTGIWSVSFSQYFQLVAGVS
jgi:hypothetical protein